MLTVSITHVAPGEGESVWIAGSELVTFKATGKDTGGAFALVELVGLPGSGPPPHIHHRVDEVYCLLEGELEVLDGERALRRRQGRSSTSPRVRCTPGGTRQRSRPGCCYSSSRQGLRDSSRRRGCREPTSLPRLLLPHQRTCRECWRSGVSTRPNTRHFLAGKITVFMHRPS